MKVLDHGFVEYVTHMGSDEDVVRAARMSTQKGFEGWGPKHESHCLIHASDSLACNCSPTPGDERLLKYLWKNAHFSPFEFGSAVFEVRAPIFVIREWMRHRTFSYNEASARYAPLDNLNYIPTVERMMMNTKGENKQAGTIAGAEELTLQNAVDYQDSLRRSYEDSQWMYECMLHDGVPKELARLVLPVGRYSTMRVSGNLRNWLQFLKLRMDTAAQWEIREYANVIHAELTKLFPRTLHLFDTI